MNASFRTNFDIDVRTRCEAIAIAPQNKTVQLRNVETGEVTTNSYGQARLVAGCHADQSAPAGHRPAGRPGAHCARRQGDRRVDPGDPACILRHGRLYGFQTLLPARARRWWWRRLIGIEIGGKPGPLGLQVTLLQRGSQVLSPMDPEMAGYVERHLVKNGVNLVLNANVCEFRQTPQGALEVLTQEGQVVSADLVVLGIGVRPEIWLAQKASYEIGERGGIRVDDHMRTSAPDIFAVGDAVEVKDYMTGQWWLAALAGPANQQGRIAADVIVSDSRYRGTQGTAIIGLFGALRPGPA